MASHPTPAFEAAAHLPDTGFELGWDYAHRGCVPPADYLHPMSPLRQGWQAGRECFGRHTLRADRHTRQWLQLRLGAWRRGRTFETEQVNPSLLRRIEASHCPITREALSHGSGEACDASVDRVNNTAGYAAGNLAVMSTRANRAKSSHGVGAALAFVRRIEACEAGHIAGLDADAWSRVAVLIAFATPLPHRQAALLPLRLLPPPRLRVLNPVQALQVMLSLQLTRAGHARRCATLASLLPGADARHAFNAFMHTMLARRLAAGRFADARAERHAVEDLWRDTLVNARWQRLALRLDAADCEHVVRLAAQRGLAGPSLRWLPLAMATEGWALESAGFAAHAAAGRTESARVDTPAADAARRMPPARAADRLAATTPANR